MTVGTPQEKRGPGKKAAALGILFFALILAVFIFRGESEIPGTLTTKTTDRETIDAKDSDTDGLKDWEEELFGTNPNLSDTDGDGINDKTEYDAFLADQENLRESSLAQGTNLIRGADWDSLTYEDKVSRLLLSNYFTFKQAGVSLNNNNMQALIDTLPAYTFSNEISPYTLTDIVITKDTSSASQKSYGNAVGSVLQNKGDSEQGALSALYAFMAFSESGDRTKFANDIQKIIGEYTAIESALIKITVPEDIATIHVDILNTLKTVVRDLEGIAMIEESAVTTLAAFGTYQDDSVLVTQAFDALQTHFKNTHITFEDTEPGHLLMQ